MTEIVKDAHEEDVISQEYAVVFFDFDYSPQASMGKALIVEWARISRTWNSGIKTNIYIVDGTNEANFGWMSKASISSDHGALVWFADGRPVETIYSVIRTGLNQITEITTRLFKKD